VGREKKEAGKVLQLQGKTGAAGPQVPATSSGLFCLYTNNPSQIANNSSSSRSFGFIRGLECMLLLQQFSKRPADEE
jgi:hypothetical protein